MRGPETNTTGKDSGSEERVPMPTSYSWKFSRVSFIQGKVEARAADAIIEPFSGYIPLLVPSDVKGMRDHRVAVPFGLLYRTGKGTFALNWTEYELESAPSFHESDLNSRGYVAHVYRAFGLRPPWTGRGKAELDPYRWGGEAQNF